MAPTRLVCASLCLLSTWAVPESSTLLQRTRVKALMSSGSGTALSELRLLESMAESSVKNGKKIDADTKAELLQLIQDELKKSKDQIDTAHAADVQAGHDIVSTYEANCQTPFDNSQSALANSLATTGSTGQKHSSHSSCRGQWVIDDTSRETECNELIAFNDGVRQSGQAALPVPADRDGFKDWWPKVKALAAQFPTWEDHDKNCRDAEDVEDATLATCNTKQGTFETAICSDKQGADSGCDAYDNCYTQASGDLGASRQDGEAGAASRKVEWEAIVKIECFANLLINDGDADALAACKVLDINTDHLDLMTTNPAFPGGLPAKKECDMFPFAAYGGYPCTQVFESTSYNGLQNLATCQPCVEETPPEPVFNCDGNNLLPTNSKECNKLDPNGDNDRLISSSGSARLVMEKEGNLVLRLNKAEGAGARVLWHTKTGGNPGAFAKFQGSDGNLVIYTRAPAGQSYTAHWSTGTHPTAAVLVVTDDCNLVKRDSAGNTLWETGTTCQTTNVISAGTTLKAGESLIAKDSGVCRLDMQSDGHLVLYKGQEALWQSDTFGHPGAEAVFQASDGNLVVYAEDGNTALWNSGAHPEAKWLAMQDNCNLVMKDADGNKLWSTGTGL